MPSGHFDSAVVHDRRLEFALSHEPHFGRHLWGKACVHVSFAGTFDQGDSQFCVS